MTLRVGFFLQNAKLRQAKYGYSTRPSRNGDESIRQGAVVVWLPLIVAVGFYACFCGVHLGDIFDQRMMFLPAPES